MIETLRLKNGAIFYQTTYISIKIYIFIYYIYIYIYIDIYNNKKAYQISQIDEMR